MAKRKSKLGSGDRFEKGVEKIERKEGLSKKAASAIMAKAGRKKYGKKAFAKMSAKGRKRSGRKG